MPLLPAQRVLICEIQRIHSRRVPLNISAAKRSHPKLIEQVYAVRPFWGWKRALEDAGLDYAKINIEYRDYVDCQICGQDFGALSYHLISQHNMTPEDYRREYPGAEIVCETIRIGIARRRRRRRDALPHWEAIWTPEYVLDRMAELHRRNLPMNFEWAHEHEKALATQALLHFGAWDKALQRIGLDPARIRLFRPTWRGYSPWRRANKRDIIAELRRRAKTGEPLSWKKILPLQHGPALLERAKKVFGSWSAALVAAGLDPLHGAVSPWGNATTADILSEIRRRKRSGQSLRSKTIWSEKWGQPLVRRAAELFGSWNDALRAVGIEPEAGKSQWADANKAAIVREIRRRHRAHEPLRTKTVGRQKRGRALFDRATRLFGSWNAALKCAGIEPARENSPWPRADKAAILAQIRRRKREGKSLETRKVERDKWGGPLIKRAKTLFGLWGEAIVAAGIEPPPGMMSPWAKADKRAILAEIHRRHRAGETVSYSKIVLERWGNALQKRAEKLFGSWNAALAAAGIHLPDRRRRNASNEARGIHASL